MVKIPDSIKEFIETQGIFVVGTVGANLQMFLPVFSSKLKKTKFIGLIFFEHKSYKNIQVNPSVTISVFNKDELEGYQFRGLVNYITDEPIKSEIKDSIIEKTLKINPSPKIKSLSEKTANVIQFEPKVCYSLNPEKYSDMSIGSDVDSTSLFGN